MTYFFNQAKAPYYLLLLKKAYYLFASWNFIIV